MLELILLLILLGVAIAGGIYWFTAGEKNLEKGEF